MSWFTQWYKKTSPEPDANDTENQPTEAQTNSNERFLGGRRYRQDIPYALPKDLGEVNRLDFQHYLLNQAIKTNHVAPLAPQQLTTVLDVGCGTGRWALEMSAEFPHVRVVGLDIEPPLISPENLHANCTFVQADALKRLPFPDNAFTYVHQRFLTAAIPVETWPEELAELVRITAPNGWIELAEASYNLEPAGPAGQQINTWINQLGLRRRVDPAIAEKLSTMLDQIPVLVDKNVYFFDLPLGEWAGREGGLMAKSYLATYQAVKPVLIDELHIDSERFDQALAVMQGEWEAMNARSRCYFAVGRKSNQPSQTQRRLKRYSW